jgi:excisionase family DNA binding protein
VDDFVSISEAARITGISRSTIYRLIAEGSLRTYASPLNRRVKLVKRADLARLMTPTPIEQDAEKDAA